MAGTEPLVLRPSRELGPPPAPRTAPAASAGPAAQADSVIGHANALPAGTQPRPRPSGAYGTWLLTATTAIALFGWLAERRRRVLLETEKDSVLWAHVQPPGASIVTTAGLDQILPDNPNAAEAARTIYVTAIGETNSRREATLIDLHQLDSKLMRRRKRGDTVAAVLLLQEHLVDFRYTSPWVFLELRELYKQLGRQQEWEIARRAFRARYGQNAPAWEAPSTADAQLLDDGQLADELQRQWPYREARMVVLRWMLGEHEMRQKCSGPPLLGLGVYRDMMMIDLLLDDVMDMHTVVSDSLL